ncbi:MAG: hypothetical protein QNJ88_14940 [Acidimicrobiia bacterium]|nr:hypothetical protein [Acidimicrobiia bacterium]
MERHTHRRSIRKGIARASVLIAVLALAPAAPAFSTDPATAPEVDIELKFVVGGVVEQYTGGGDEEVYASMPVELLAEFGGMERISRGGEAVPGSWVLEEWYAGGGPRILTTGEVYDSATSVELTHELRITNYDGTFGGGSGVYGHWTLKATNPGDPDTTTTAHVAAYPDVFQEDGTDLTSNEPDADITTRGKWRSSYCDCWLGGEVLRTWQKWARMRLTIDAIDGQVVAVVMPMAPNRGQAKIKLDDVYQGRVDTYSPTRDNRIIVWQTAPLQAGTHTIDVINLATEGRPRIDVDAFLVTYGNVEP